MRRDNWSYFILPPLQAFRASGKGRCERYWREVTLYQVCVDWNLVTGEPVWDEEKMDDCECCGLAGATYCSFDDGLVPF
jgi:hypothetical protein